MKLTQKRAIWYTLRKKQLEEQRNYLFEHNMMKEFEKSKYKTMTWFLKLKGISA